jgi:hypothetical protein|tara:strand:- start:917 stop:1180 length:264 start_codon:yes stop_codon:yes gene_type:complete
LFKKLHVNPDIPSAHTSIPPELDQAVALRLLHAAPAVWISNESAVGEVPLETAKFTESCEANAAIGARNRPMVRGREMRMGDISNSV